MSLPLGAFLLEMLSFSTLIACISHLALISSVCIQQIFVKQLLVGHFPFLFYAFGFGCFQRTEKAIMWVCKSCDLLNIFGLSKTPFRDDFRFLF